MYSLKLQLKRVNFLSQFNEHLKISECGNNLDWSQEEDLFNSQSTHSLNGFHVLEDSESDDDATVECNAITGTNIQDPNISNQNLTN